MQSSVVLLDSATGNVLAIAGDPQALHMPGSALAPLSVYAPALEKGAVTPESTVQDQPLFPEKKWPVNPYGTYRGTITVSDALSVKSSCVPVWILDQYLTPEYTAAIWSGYASHEQVTLPQNPSVRLWRQMMEGVFDKL